MNTPYPGQISMPGVAPQQAPPFQQGYAPQQTPPPGYVPQQTQTSPSIHCSEANSIRVLDLIAKRESLDSVM